MVKNNKLNFVNVKQLHFNIKIITFSEIQIKIMVLSALPFSLSMITVKLIKQICSQENMLINLFQAIDHFLYLLKSLENQRFFLCVQKAYKETSGQVIV